MSDELSKKTSEFLVKLIGDLEKVENGAMAEAPAVLWEVVAYGRFSSTAAMVFAVAFFVGCFWLAGKASSASAKAKSEEPGPNRSAKEIKQDQEMFGFAIVASVLVGLVVPFIVVCVWTGTFFKSWLAPRVYAIEYLIDAVK